MCEGIHIKKFKSGDLMLGMLKPYLKKAPKGQPSTRKTEGRLVLFIYFFFLHREIICSHSVGRPHGRLVGT
jgi:hypothetical protein